MSGLDKLAYSIPNFASAVDLSISSIYEDIAAGKLVPSYRNSKPLISKKEGERYLESLPKKKVEAA